jgi:recombinational DNA repair ATPase RecF
MSVENFQKIKVFNLEPKGNVIKITGANASGKSSVLDAIMLALAGARGGPSAPVRRGAGRGVVRLDLGDIRVTRMWSEGSDSKGEMWIEAADGRRYGTPQRMLDELMGRISFDPLAFIRMDAKQQAEELRNLLDLDDVLAAIRADEQNDYNTRREQTKLLKTLEAQRANVHVPENLPAKKRDLDAMTEELAQVAEYNVAIERERLKREGVERQRAELAARVERRLERIADLRKEIDALQAETEQDITLINETMAVTKSWKPLAEPKDAAAISQEIAEARTLNAAIDRRAQAERMDEEIDLVAKTITKLDAAIEELRSKASSVIAEAKYPVAGLGFTDDGVTFNGLGFAQASNAEQIKVSIAMGMALNPKLRVMRIKDGSLLDDDSMAVVEALAVEHDFQVFVEIVDVTGKLGVYLVDGEIATIDGEVRAPLQVKKSLGPARKKPVRKETV